MTDPQETQKPLRPVVVVGQTPPPVHGQSVMIQAMLDALRPAFDVTHVRMRFSDEAGETGRFSLSKIARLFPLAIRLRRELRRHPGAVLYYPPAPPSLAPVLRDLVLLTAARGLAGRTLFHFHAGGLGGYLDRRPLLKRMARRVLFRPDAAILQGPSCPRDDRALEARKTFYVPNGCDVDVLPSARGTGPRPVVLYVGLHAESKGLFDLLETARRCRELGVDAEFRTVGTWKAGGGREEWESKRDALGLRDTVRPLGFLEGRALAEAYAAADVFYFPTFYPFETQGVVLLEAMANGLPVVSTRWSGPSDVVEDGRTGLLCDVHDADAFAAALARLCREPALRDGMGRAGRVRYERHYTAARFAESMRGVFRELAGT